MVITRPDALERASTVGLVGCDWHQAEAGDRQYLQQHPEPRDALEGQQQDGRQREPRALGEALQLPQLRGEAHVRIPAKTAQTALASA